VGKTNARDKGLQEKKETNQRFNHLKKKTHKQLRYLFIRWEKKVKKFKIKIKKNTQKLKAAVPSCGLNFDLSSLQSKMTMTKARKRKNNVYF
jgi:hypothetical protein